MHKSMPGDWSDVGGPITHDLSGSVYLSLPLHSEVPGDDEQSIEVDN